MYNTQNQICLICGANNMEKLGSHKDRRKGLPGSWSLFKCKDCEVTSLLPSPSEVELSEYYSKYYSVNSNVKEVTFELRTGSKYPSIRKLYHWISGDIDPRDFIKPNTNSVMLDYGCGEGGCLYDFHSQGIKIYGAEISSEMVKAGLKAGLNVQQITNIDQIPFENNSFDIIYLMQVLEHLSNPHVFLNELLRITKPGGVIYVAVPNSKSFWKGIFGKNWVSGWFAPYHLFHYDKKSLSRLAREHGFEVLKTWNRTSETWFRLNIKACLYPNDKRLEYRHSIVDSFLLRIPLMVVLRILEFFIHQRDCLVIQLVKPVE
jgi:2-polyprenyl-3-methyl-5-hydroxy-6-metoxy-1,4-benzoquinol methylase